MLVLLWVFWHYGWKAFALDQLRQNLFSLRGELFDLVADGNSGLEFDDDAYIAMREMLNNRLRFAHRMTFAYVWITALFVQLPFLRFKQSFESYEPPIEAELKRLKNPEIKKQLAALDRRTNIALLGYMVQTSPVLFCCIGITFFGFLLHAFLLHGISGATQLALRRILKRETKSSIRAVGFQADTMEPAGASGEFCPA